MNEEKVLNLLDKYRKGTLSPEEEQRLNEWYLITVIDGKAELTAAQKSKLLYRIRQNLPLQKAAKKVKLWVRISSAAAAVLLIGIAVYFLAPQGNPQQQDLQANKISPGTMGATLTLSNGKKISLGSVRSGEIAVEQGVTVAKSDDGQLMYEMKPSAVIDNRVNTLTTSLGQTYILVLPDKSKVWLNAGSSVTFSASLLNKGQRKVTLTGEAYFEVTKDPAHPFVVKTVRQELEVLGTTFNVNAYKDEVETTTTLIEGSVKISAGRQTKLLKPGEQSSYSGNNLDIKTANLEESIAWKAGDFYLDHVDFKVAMRKIARWYNVEVIYDDSVPDEIETGGWVSRSRDLSSVLKVIEASGLVRFKVEGRKVFVSK